MKWNEEKLRQNKNSDIGNSLKKYFIYIYIYICGKKTNKM